MAVIDIIKSTAKQVGITAVVTNSDSKLQTQLNRLKDASNDPMALISWDLTSTVTFDDNGFLNNPTTPVTMLLMSKSESPTKENMELKAEEMGELFIKFIKTLRGALVKYNRSISSNSILTGIQFQLVPKYGLSQHSGIIGRFTMISSIENC